MCVHIGDAITGENTKHNDFPYTCIIPTSISILLFIMLLFFCLFCFFYNRLHHKRNISRANSINSIVLTNARAASDNPACDHKDVPYTELKDTDSGDAKLQDT